MLTIKGVIKRYGTKTALSGFSLTAGEGEAVVIMGPSGCGKSTALRTINRLVEPDEGDITWKGRSVMAMGPCELSCFRRKVGFVFQRSNLIARLNVIDNVILPSIAAGRDRKAAEIMGRASLEAVNLLDRAYSPVNELSGGEMQRVAIARAITGRPELILWDEPTASLDPIMVVGILEVMEGLIRSLKTTMVIVTHEIGFASRCADRVVLLERGSVVEHGTPKEVFECPSSRLGMEYRRLMHYSSLPAKMLA